MQLHHLRHDEQLVLVGLFHWVMNADGVISPQESNALGSLRKRMRIVDWDALLAEAKEKLPDVPALIAACGELERPSACQLIYEELVVLAAVDRVDEREVDLLNWLAVTWGFVSREEVAEALEKSKQSPEDAAPTEDDDYDLLG